MASALSEAVEAFDIAACAGDIEDALRQVDRLEAKVAGALGAFDEDDQGWSLDGSLSLAAWVAWHGRRQRKDAHRLAMAATKLRSLPVTARAWEEGLLSSAHVQAITTNVSEAHLAVFAEQEAELVGALSGLSAREAAVAMRTWRLRAEALDDGPEPAERPSELHISRTMEGRAEVSGHLGADDAAVVEAAIAAATTEPSPGEDRPSGPERRAQALVDLCSWFLANVGQPSGTRNRPQVSVIADIDDLEGDGPARYSDGTPLGHTSLEWLSCDCELHRVLRKGRSSVLDYGASTRVVSRALFSALVIRDGHCRHPGCDRGPSWCEGHHVVHFSKGGPTRLENLVLACARHHHLWHEQGWHLELLPDATLVLKSPWGLVLTSRPPPGDL